MPANLIVIVVFALLLSGLVVAFILRRDFRDAVLGGPGEASVLGILSVKGVAIVLLCGLLIGGILLALTRFNVQPPVAGVNPRPANNAIDMHLYVAFDPEVNARNLTAQAFIKTRDGTKAIPSIPILGDGGFSINLTVPDMETPFFITFTSPKGVWQTPDRTVRETRATAHLQGSGDGP